MTVSDLSGERLMNVMRILFFQMYYAMTERMFSTSGTNLKKVCMQNKLQLLEASVRHLGTDKNYVVLQHLYDELKDKSICLRDLRGKAVSAGLLKSVMESFDSDAAAQDSSGRILAEKVFSHGNKTVRAEHAFCFLYDDRKQEEKK